MNPVEGARKPADPESLSDPVVSAGAPADRVGVGYPSDRVAVVVAMVAVAGARWPGLVAVPWLWAVLGVGSIVLAAWADRRNTRLLALLVVVLIAVSILSQRAGAGLAWRGPVAVAGWATIIRDPEPTPFGTQAEVVMFHRHLLATAAGPPGWSLLRLAAGQRVLISGAVRRLDPPPGWLRARHIGARLTIREVRGWRAAPQPWRAVNGLRDLLIRGGRVLPRGQQPLYGGFILGDDRGQRAEITDDFRGAGLSHLLVVSGQNVAFLFVAAGPLLRRLGWRARYGAGLTLLLGFLVLTRFEPSVLRAVAMAGITLTARAKGSVVSPLRALALAVTGLILIDPLLVWSVGFGMSVGACLGIAVLAGPIRRRVPGPAWLAEPLGVTLAAQIGTAPFLVGIFGGLPIASLPANLLALPAAEPVMVWGLTGGLAAGICSGIWNGRVASLLHLPTHFLLSWVAVVARVAAWAPLDALRGWLVVIVCLALLMAAALRRPITPEEPSHRLSGVTPVAGLRARSGRLLPAIAAGAAVSLGAGAVLPRAGDYDRRLDGGGRLWRTAANELSWRPTVVVLNHQRLDRLLPSLRAKRVRRIDVLVVEGRMSLDDLRAVLARIPSALVLAPLRAKLLTAGRQVREVPPGSRAIVGPFVVTLRPSGGVEVADARRPP